jgi:hypothetical protein
MNALEAYGAIEIADVLSMEDLLPSDNVGEMELGDKGNAESHIYVAFLRTGAVQGGPCCGCHPGNWLKQKYTGGEFMHVQPFFIRNNKIISFTVDSSEGCVHATENKTFSRKEWEFFAIPRSAPQIETMWNWGLAQLNKPYNSNVLCDFMCLKLVPTTDDMFHCAHFTLRMLQEGGLFKQGFDPAYMTDAKLYQLVYGLRIAKRNPAIDTTTRNVLGTFPASSDNLFVRM